MYTKLLSVANLDLVTGMNDVTVGSCAQYDNQNVQINMDQTEVLWQKATSLLPNLKKAQLKCVTVTLRQHPFIRIELEDVKLCNGSKLSVLHHYGHGDFKFLSPGTAITVSQLVRENL